MGINWAEHTVEIDAPIETCFDAIVDYESFPGWQSAVTSTEVETRTKDGLGERVTLFLSTKGQKVDYTLLYRYDHPTGIEWDFVEGHGVDDVDGNYTFEDLGEDRTRATYKLGIDPSLPVPGIVARRIHRSALESSVEELKAEAEKRHAEGYEPEKPKRRFGFGSGDAEEEPAEEEPVMEEVPVAEAPPTTKQAPAPEREPAAAPQGHAERAVSTGRDVAESAVRAGLGVAGAAVGLARGAAETAVGIGREAAGAVSGRLGRLLGQDDREKR